MFKKQQRENQSSMGHLRRITEGGGDESLTRDKKRMGGSKQQGKLSYTLPMGLLY